MEGQTIIAIVSDALILSQESDYLFGIVKEAVYRGRYDIVESLVKLYPTTWNLCKKLHLRKAIVEAKNYKRNHSF